MRTDVVFWPKLMDMDNLEIDKVGQWVDFVVILRCCFVSKRLAPIEQSARRECLRRFKYAFGTAEIKIPYPHVTVYADQVKNGSVPPMPLWVGGHSALGCRQMKNAQEAQ